LTVHKIANAEPCTVFVDYPSYALYDWLQGWELFESYMQLSYPLVECEDIYPFNVTDVAMTLALNAPGSLYVQAFIAELDPVNSTPECPYPGEFIEVTEVFPGYISQAGVYMLGIDFELPVPVDGPYFAGIYYACDMTIFDPGIAIDTIPYNCLDYNDWGEGPIDLATNPYYPFPGSIDLFSVGYHGEAPQDGTPIPYILLPENSGLLTPEAPLWTAELTDTLSYQGAVFERLDDTAWVPFGVDFDGTITLRDGLNAADTADGWRAAWSPSGFVDTSYLIRATVVGTDTVFASDTITVFYRGTPLTANISAPNAFAQFCDTDTVVVATTPIADSVRFGWRQLSDFVQHSPAMLDRASFGDSDGDIYDGNHFYEGEFGEYYVGPTTLAALIDYWAGRGFADLYPLGDSVQNVNDLVEWLATMSRTRNNLGSQDDNLLTAARGFIATRGVELEVAIGLPPTWSWLQEQFIAEEAAVALAIAEPIGHWLTLASIDLSATVLDSIPVTLYDPIGAVARSSVLHVINDSLYVGYPIASQLRFVDLAVAIQPTAWNDSYSWWAVDMNAADGFQANLPASGLTSGDNYLLCASTYLDDLIFDAFQIFEYECQAAYLPGDADGSGAINVSDAVYLINFIFASGPPPQPELLAGDANCDAAINVSDVVYLINYIFAGGPAPCSI
jgi:hypothetical protein